MRAEPIRVYANGGDYVQIFSDGTKTREKLDDTPPEFPESVDLKITDYCDAGCPHCHESSTKRGKHSDLDWIRWLFSGMDSIEVAIGGGNPLSHPEFDAIVAALGAPRGGYGCIANVTINERNLTTHEEVGRIVSMIGRKAIRGLGISVEFDADRIKDSLLGLCRPCPSPMSVCTGALFDLPNTVAHLIAGVHPAGMALRYKKVLILGFKEFGFGAKRMDAAVKENIRHWRYHLPAILGAGGIVCFDNLALEQLRVKDVVAPEVWEKAYMGKDGEHSMYIDAVRREYAVSSTSKRYKCRDKTLREMFAHVRTMSGFPAAPAEESR